VLADEPVSDVTTVRGLAGWELARVHALPAATAVPLRDPDSKDGYAPAPGGSQFLVWQLPPDEIGRNPAGMHATDTVDYVIVLSGSVTQLLDSGEHVHLSAGDCLVQGGNAHEWSNQSGQPCVMAVVMVGAARA
jgi:mannose-6-phosphate isomerase-like protein (cupin superfamily)